MGKVYVYAKERSEFFRGKSGKQYPFGVYTKDSTFTDDKNLGAVYIFSKDGHKMEPLYIGETNELGTRMAHHEKWECVEQHGCTHICIMYSPHIRDRKEAETDLRNNYDTPCNRQ